MGVSWCCALNYWSKLCTFMSSILEIQTPTWWVFLGGVERMLNRGHREVIWLRKHLVWVSHDNHPMHTLSNGQLYLRTVCDLIGCRTLRRRLICNALLCLCWWMMYDFMQYLYADFRACFTATKVLRYWLLMRNKNFWRSIYRCSKLMI